MTRNLKDFVTPIHKKTSRNYLERMINSKIKAMETSREYGFDYWDGERKHGYGGYQYIPDYWTPVAEKLIKTYGLTEKSKILDIGCGKGFLLYEIKKILPKIEVYGIDISQYAIANAKAEIAYGLTVADARHHLKFSSEEFDLAISLGVFHNFKLDELEIAINEISRVSKMNFIMVESYRNISELFNLQCWALTANTFLEPDEWQWLFKRFGYHGDFEFIFFE